MPERDNYWGYIAVVRIFAWRDSIGRRLTEAEVATAIEDSLKRSYDVRNGRPGINMHFDQSDNMSPLFTRVLRVVR